MALREEFKQFSENAKREMKHLYERIKQYLLTCLICIIAIVTAAILLIAFPLASIRDKQRYRKSHLENQSRATLATILGVITVGIGLFYTWR